LHQMRADAWPHAIADAVMSVAAPIPAKSAIFKGVAKCL
jgi:hypothetical protein